MEQTILYLDPWTGISGDMVLAALLDLDRDGTELEGRLRTAVAAVGLDPSLVEIQRDVEGGLSCTRLRVRPEPAPPLRHLSDMERLIGEAALPDKVRTAALAAVRRLATVEATIHACALEDVHLHEVGAADTLVDIVGTFALVEALSVDMVLVGTIPVGGGTVENAHGRMGIPAPATAKLLEGYAVAGGPEMRELTTPTGALLVRQLGAVQGSLPPLTVDKVGYGAGAVRLAHGPNVLRVLLGTAVQEVSAGTGGAVSLASRRGTSQQMGESSAGEDTLIELQANLDDVSPEIMAHTMDALREAGAVDVWSASIQMKKGRPGVLICALVDPGKEEAAAAALFRESGTLGVRRHEVSRRLAARGIITVTVGGSEVRVKWGRWQGRLISVAAEYEDAARVARATGVPVKEVMQVAVQAAWELLGCGVQAD